MSGSSAVWRNGVMSSGATVWKNRHALGAEGSQTRATTGGIVTAEGGGFYPTLSLGGGAGTIGSSDRGRPA
ncbi:MAG: hypothetical protein ACJ75Q_13105 [Gaiellaceae bacterium]